MHLVKYICVLNLSAICNSESGQTLRAGQQAKINMKSLQCDVVNELFLIFNYQNLCIYKRSYNLNILAFVITKFFEYLLDLIAREMYYYQKKNHNQRLINYNSTLKEVCLNFDDKMSPLEQETAGLWNFLLCSWCRLSFK